MEILSLSVVNVWLCVQNARWLMYSYPVSRMLPGVDYQRSFDPILEVPGIIIGAAAAYLLLYRLALSIWRIRSSLFQDALTIKVLSINSLILVALTALGIGQWLVFYAMLAPDLIGAAAAGAVSAIISFALDRSISARNPMAYGRYRSLAFLRLLGHAWGRPNKL